MKKRAKLARFFMPVNFDSFFFLLYNKIVPLHMSASATTTLSLVDVSARLPSSPRETTISSQRAYIGIDGENFHFLVKGLGYQNIRIHDFVRCIAEHLNIPFKKGHITGVLVTPHSVHYGKGKAVETTGLKLVPVTDFRKEADDGVLRAELNEAHNIGIIVVVSNDLGAYLKVILNQKRKTERIVIAGSRVSRCGWGTGNDTELKKNGIDFFELADVVNQFADKAPEEVTPPPVEPAPGSDISESVQVPIGSEHEKTLQPAARPERKRSAMSQVNIYINQTQLETTADAVYVILEQIGQIYHENLQISMGDITGCPKDEITQISFSTYTRMSRTLLPRIMTGLRDYSKAKGKVLPGVLITANHI